MSNVLIGIIGVILFIGLALAGALILGDDFRMSRASTEAAGIQQQMAQVSAAYEMYRVKMGSRPVPVSAHAHLMGRETMVVMMPRFLKTLPPQTDRPNSWWFFVDENGDPAAREPAYVMFNIAGSDRSAAQVCDAVAEMAGMADSADKARTYGKPPADKAQGCYNYGLSGKSCGWMTTHIRSDHAFRRPRAGP
jgi:hypothetical protein